MAHTLYTQINLMQHEKLILKLIGV
jgi:hypothetical protein